MREFYKKASFVFVGGFTQGLGMGMFLFPHAIPSGGAGGIAVLFHYFFQINMGLALWIVNFSMLLLAIKYLGNSSTLWTMVAMTVTSMSVYFFQNILDITLGNTWIDLILGSLFLGLGIGLLLREGVSNGGVGVIALIFANTRGILPGKTLLWLNGIIFVIIAFIVRWEIIIQALISQWLATKMVDRVFKSRRYR
ncbi:YitT family protein [Metabacillus malikii]|uniref:Uncharacterized membrane-anchored protein YitT (DUF2179 family) n=1 Tax=Metabacillus malikii TaxID=1504265 RepID=A0ABT9ZL92_9BACI|nr:YitT family protein [Metabacillus malikii]MDQ0232552.1 uncharacterized membrane-anchored protein YitT (DUF2179 family) [Metabacillus malikii]